MSRRVTAAGALGLALALAGCLAPPDLKTCAELPLGTAGCPAACDVYCDVMATNCPDTDGEGGADAQAKCRADCSEMLVPGVLESDKAGADANTLECRIAHALRAPGHPAECDAASLEGGGVCADRSCDTYCAVLDAQCPGRFPDVEACKATCAVYPDDVHGVTAPSNSVECRAVMARRTLCDAAGVTGGGSCGTPCDAYCDQLDAHCGEHPLYPDRGTCEATCALLPADGSDADTHTEIDTLQCRIYHATYPAALDPVKHCPHAGVYHAAHCGPICDTYCDLMGANCPGNYATAAACAADCAALLAAHTPLWPDPGATVECKP